MLLDHSHFNKNSRNQSVLTKSSHCATLRLLLRLMPPWLAWPKTTDYNDMWCQMDLIVIGNTLCMAMLGGERKEI